MVYILDRVRANATVAGIVECREVAGNLSLAAVRIMTCLEREIDLAAKILVLEM